MPKSRFVYTEEDIAGLEFEEKEKDMTEKFLKAQVANVSEELGLVFGWAIVSKDAGQPYFDTQGDHIPEESMLKAAADFMSNSRMAKEMHTGDQIGSVVFAWPMTAQIAKAMGVSSGKTGLMVAVKVSPMVLEKFRTGVLTGFSIGGQRLLEHEIEEDE